MFAGLLASMTLCKHRQGPPRSQTPRQRKTVNGISLARSRAEYINLDIDFPMSSTCVSRKRTALFRAEFLLFLLMAPISPPFRDRSQPFVSQPRR